MKDQEFYRLLAEIGGNEHLRDLLHELEVKVRFIQISRALQGEGPPAAPAEHQEILDGLSSRDPQAVQEALRRHLGGFYGIDPRLF